VRDAHIYGFGDPEPIVYPSLPPLAVKYPWAWYRNADGEDEDEDDNDDDEIEEESE
jgi:hypothetical protein